MNYSVLMSVYQKEKPEYLKQSMDSIWDQTVQTNDFVLVCDGPLTLELDRIIDEMEIKHKEILKVVRLSENKGLGIALNEGLKHCKNEFVARMDSDDISRKDRCERQLKIFEGNPEISIISGTIEEFVSNPKDVEALRILPQYQEDILSFSKKRNPFNHPCVMYKKNAVEAAGGYQDFYLLEDYYLWIRMLNNGAIGYNIKEPLLWMRAGTGMYKRRSGLKYALSQKKLFRYMREIGYISYLQYIKSTVVRMIGAIIPTKIRAIVYKLIIRKKRKSRQIKSPEKNSK